MFSSLCTLNERKKRLNGLKWKMILEEQIEKREVHPLLLNLWQLFANQEYSFYFLPCIKIFRYLYITCFLKCVLIGLFKSLWQTSLKIMYVDVFSSWFEFFILSSHSKRSNNVNKTWLKICVSKQFVQSIHYHFHKLFTNLNTY